VQHIRAPLLGCFALSKYVLAGNMLFQVEALLESLSEAGTAVDLATQAAFKDLRTRTLKQQREAFATQAGTVSAQKKIAWEDVRPRNPIKFCSLHIDRGRHVSCRWTSRAVPAALDQSHLLRSPAPAQMTYSQLLQWLQRKRHQQYHVLLQTSPRSKENGLKLSTKIGEAVCT
jgi:hypothetical protein